jgi:TonB-linked SusC/RagA family outer membrane protein
MAQVKLQGTVVDESGLGLPGVNVVVKGTTKGSVTDIDGKFEFTADDVASKILVFSSMGYSTQELPIGQMVNFKVTMKEDVVGLDEVVVTALGIKKQEKTLTYAQQTVKGDELMQARDNNFMNALAGKAAGVDIKKSSSGAGGSTKITLRGDKNMTGSSDPLFVIDGIPMVNNRGGQPGMWGGTDGGDGLSQLNPDDIESMTILKGANAAALYGSQGSNGVIVITTKSGKSGSLDISLNSGITFESVTNLPELQYDYGAESGKKESWSKTKGSYDDSFVEDFFQMGYNFNNSVTISGGGDKTKSYLSYSNVKSEGVVPTNEYKKHNLTYKQSIKLFEDKLEVEGRVMLSDEDTDNRPASGYYLNPLTGLYLFPRNLSYDDYKSNYYKLDEARQVEVMDWHVADHHQSNPEWILQREKKMYNKKRVISNLSLNINLYENLYLKLRGNYDYAVKTREEQHAAGSNITNIHENGAWVYNKTEDKTYYGDMMLTYNKKIQDFDFNVIAGATYENSVWGDGLNINTGNKGLRYANVFHAANVDYSQVMPESVYGGKRITESVFGNLQVGFKDMVYLDLSGRNEWSSTLWGTGNESYFFPAAGLTFLVHEMVKLPKLIDFAKLRTSFSMVANEIPYNMVSPRNKIGKTGVVVNNVAPLDNLDPEMVSTMEFGLDMRFFKGRVGLDFTYYDITSSDQFFEINAQSGSTYKTLFVNAGEIKNSGVEVTLSLIPLRMKDFEWTTKFNYSNNNSEVVDIADELGGKVTYSGSEGYQLRLVEGEQYGDLYVHKFDRDEQGRIKLDDKGNIKRTGREKIGNINADWKLGWTNNFYYKNFSFSFLIDASIGGVVYSQTESILDGYGVSKRTGDARDAGSVSINAVDHNGSPVSSMDPEKYYTKVGNRNGVGEEYVYDRDNIRLTQVSLGYNFDLKKYNLPIKGASLSLVANNLLYLYKDAPFDPELTMSTSRDNQSLDNFNVPSVRTFGFNVKLKL